MVKIWNSEQGVEIVALAKVGVFDINVCLYLQVIVNHVRSIHVLDRMDTLANS